MSASYLICRSGDLAPAPTRRPGLRERRLLTGAGSRHQNLVLIDADPGAQVALHPVEPSESLFILLGRFRVTAPEGEDVLGPGDLVHFPPGAAHGLECIEGPGQFLAIFAPAA